MEPLKPDEDKTFSGFGFENLMKLPADTLLPHEQIRTFRKSVLTLLSLYLLVSFFSEKSMTLHTEFASDPFDLLSFCTSVVYKK